MNLEKKFDVEKFIYIIILTVMILIPLLKLSTYIPAIERFYITTFEIKRVYVLWISIFFLLSTYLYSITSQKEKIGLTDILIYILIILAFFSTKYAINFQKAFLGESYRYEGLLTILSYYFLFLNTKSIKEEKYKKNIINLFIAIGIFQALYGIMQTYTEFTFIRRHASNHMAMGLCSNPNFFGSYMVMQLLIVGYMYIYNPKKSYLIMYILFGIALYIALSTGPSLSAIVALIFSIFIIPKKFKKIIKLTIVLILSFILANLSLKAVQTSELKKQVIKSQGIVSEITTITQRPKETIGSGRLVVWENSIPLVKKYWLIGCGLDNFKNAYPNSGPLKYDKAHNVYLQIAVTNGLPALIIFLILLFIAFIKGIKLKNGFITPIYMAFIGYSIQAFFNISVIDVAPYYYIILGIILSKSEEEILNKNDNNNEKKIKIFSKKASKFMDKKYSEI